MSKQSGFTLALVAVIALATTAAHAATITPIGSYDPNTYFDDGFIAGIDFDDGPYTEPGFLGIPASNNKTYNVTTNGVTFDIVVSNANLANQNRARAAANGNLVRDFEQWYGNTGTPPEAKITLTGLAPNTSHDVTVFHFNDGSFQNPVNFYDGASSADPLIGTYTPQGNKNNFAAWSPGAILTMTSDATGQIVLTAQAGNNGQRLNINGIMVVPEPASLALLGLLAVSLSNRGGLLVARRRR